jgi:8-oxo-dGTP pyrophosphatase MutT (NUDIX family)
VLVTLADGSSGPEVLLTRRSWKLRSHRGEMSFPGGRTDPGETPVETALREAHEEVGLDPSDVTVHGELEHLNTVVSRSYIVPKVATVAEPLPLEPRTMEVDRVMWVPLAEFTRPDTYRSEVWGVGPTDRTLHFFELDDETVWGATAHMLVDLLTRTLGVSFDTHVDCPVRGVEW